MKTIAFFNHQSQVGKTSLVYHLAWMYADFGLKVVVADLDPQSDLTFWFLEPEILEERWPDDDEYPLNILDTMNCFVEDTGEFSDTHLKIITENLSLIAGNLGLSQFEDKLSEAWHNCLNQDQAAFRIISSFYRLLSTVAAQQNADVVLIDVGPNLGAINKAALIAADYIIIPLVADWFALQALRDIGYRLRYWREAWAQRLHKTTDTKLPAGKMQVAGYVMLQHSIHFKYSIRASVRWKEPVHKTYRQAILNDNDCLSVIRNYRSLMPMAMEAHKPIFHLKPADGAIGSHAEAVRDGYGDFKQLAINIANVCAIDMLE
jgi:cellulose biosynthesis protein BcsQ